MAAIQAAVSGFLVGILLFLVAPIGVSPLLAAPARTRVANALYHMSMTLLDRVTVVRRDNGGVSITRTSYDPGRRGEKTDVDGEEYVWGNTADFVGKFKNKIILMAPESRSCLVDPRLAEAGELRQKQVRDGGAMREIDGEEAATTFLKLPDAQRLVDLKNAVPLVHGQAGPELSETAYNYAMKSQEGFQTSTAKKAMVLIFAWLAGAGFAWLLISQGGAGGGLIGGGGGGLDNPIGNFGVVITPVIP